MCLPELSNRRRQLRELGRKIGPGMKLGVREVPPDETQALEAIQQGLERPAGCEAEWATEVAVLDDRHLRLAGAENVVPLPDRGEPA